MNRAKYLAKNTAAFALFNFGTRIINFFLVPLYTNLLTTEQYGITDLVFTICFFVTPILMLNIGESVMRFPLDKGAERNKIMSVGILVMLMSMVTGLLVYVAAGFYTPVSEYKSYIYWYAVTYAICEIMLSYLRGKELLIAFSLGNIIRTFAIAGLNILFLIGFSMKVEGYLLAYVLANVVSAIFCFVAGNILDVIKHFSLDKTLLVNMIKYSVPLIPTSLMWWIINSSDLIMITSMVGISASGIYAVSSKIPSLISVISTTFNQAFSYSAIHEEESQDRIEFNNRIFDYLFAVVTICGLGVLLIIKTFMRFYVSEAYYIAWTYSVPLVVGTCFMVFGSFFSVSYTVNKDSIGFLKSGIAGAVTNLTFNLILIHIIGAFGAAIATLMTYIIVFLFRFYDTRKYLPLKVFTKKHIVSIFMLILGGISVYMGTMVNITLCGCFVVICFIIYRENWISVAELVLKKRLR